jgi:hypothetical protein
VEATNKRGPADWPEKKNVWRGEFPCEEELWKHKRGERERRVSLGLFLVWVCAGLDLGLNVDWGEEGRRV